jgi:hypothetical protein
MHGWEVCTESCLHFCMLCMLAMGPMPPNFQYGKSWFLLFANKENQFPTKANNERFGRAKVHDRFVLAIVYHGHHAKSLV